MSIRAVVIVVAGFASGVSAPAMCPQSSSEPVLTSASPVEFDASVPPSLQVKRAPTGHLLVRPRINGRDAGWFIFDTGAGICCIAPAQVEAIGLRESGVVMAQGVGGSTPSRLFTADSLGLGPARFKDHVLMETDLEFLTPHLGEAISGVIGYGVISRCVVEVDLEHARVSLHDPAESALASLPWEELLLQERLPVVKARVEGHEGMFRLDTGANGHVTLHAGAVRKWDMLRDRAVTDARMGGVGGFVAAKQGTVEWIEFGGVRSERVPARFMIEDGGAMGDDRREGTIGVELLKPFTLMIDYPRSRIAFVKRGQGSPETEAPSAK